MGSAEGGGKRPVRAANQPQPMRRFFWLRRRRQLNQMRRISCRNPLCASVVRHARSSCNWPQDAGIPPVLLGSAGHASAVMPPGASRPASKFRVRRATRAARPARWRYSHQGSQRRTSARPAARLGAGKTAKSVSTSTAIRLFRRDRLGPTGVAVVPGGRAQIPAEPWCGIDPCFIRVIRHQTTRISCAGAEHRYGSGG